MESEQPVSAFATLANMVSGVLIALGSIVLLIGFLAFQWISLVGFGMTGLQLAMDATNPSSVLSLLSGAQQITTLIVLLPSGIVILLLSFRLVRKPNAPSVLNRFGIVLLSAANMYPLYLAFSSINQNSASTLLGVGFWITLIANIVVFLAALLGR